MDPEQKKVFDKLSAQCARREYCVTDVRNKALKALDGDVERAAAVVDALVADGYADDLRYAGAFAREKASLSGWGPVKIRYALRAKGVVAGTIDEALQEIDSDKAADRLGKLLDVKRKSLQGDPQLRLKLIRFALSRGYEYEEVQKYV